MTKPNQSVICRVGEEWLTAAHGTKGAVLERAARLFGVSRDTVEKWLRDAGYESRRKRRSDAGVSTLSDDELDLVAGVLRASLNQKGQRMPVRTALKMLHASGQLSSMVHESTVSRQLYQRQLHPEQMALPEPSVRMRSRHPNHVWQVDSTTGAYYYLPGGRLRWMPEDQFYKNKVANLVKASTDLLTRYAVSDHTSHAGKARHYLGGETVENLLDFLVWAIWKQDSSPMHGAPLVLVMDPGPANRSQALVNFCKRLGIKPIWHAPGSARVTGSVEKWHDLVRMHFETRFRFRRPEDVTIELLNADVEAWAAAYCTEEIHTRHGQSRYGAWMRIQPEQLRVPASLEALREAATREPETRRVANDKRISFGGRTYNLALVPGAVAGLKVTVVSNVFRAPAVDVLFTDADTGEQTWHVVEPEATDQAGFPLDAPVWGEDMRTAAFSDVDRNRNALTRQAYRTGDGLPTVEEAARARKAHAPAYAGLVDSMADVRAAKVPTYLPRRSTPLGLPERRVEARRLNLVEAAKLLKDRLGTAYTPQVFAELSARFGEAGVPADQVDALVRELLPPGAEPRRAASGGLA